MRTIKEKEEYSFCCSCLLWYLLAFGSAVITAELWCFRALTDDAPRENFVSCDKFRGYVFDDKKYQAFKKQYGGGE